MHENHLPSSIFTKFIAASWEPVYCCPLTNRQGMPKQSAKTYTNTNKRTSKFKPNRSPKEDQYNHEKGEKQNYTVGKILVE